MEYTGCNFFVDLKIIREKSKIEGGEVKIAKDAPKLYSEATELWQQYINKSLWEIYRSTQFCPNSDNANCLAKAPLTLDDIKGSLPYSDNIDDYNEFNYNLRKKIHVGQLKLFLSELQSLNEIVKLYGDNVLVIYTGAAPSMKLWFLMLLFPNVRFLLVDPNEFFIYDGRYSIPHYVRQDPDYVEHGDKWGVYTDRSVREANAQDYVYLGYSDSNMYESPFYKNKNILWFNPKTGKLERRNKPITNSGYGKSHKDIVGKNRIFNLFERTEQASIDYVFDSCGRKSGPRVFFAEEFFTDDLARMVAKSAERYSSVKFCFWSDIRTNMYDRAYPSDTDIALNSAWMIEWMSIMKPDYSMIKFRLPFRDSEGIKWDQFEDDFAKIAKRGIDMKSVYERTGNLLFFDGEVRLQAWEGNLSSETRLIVKREAIETLNVREWDFTEYEQKLFFFNMIQRFGVLYENPLVNEELGIDNCADCAIEAQIWLDYKELNPNIDIIDTMKKLEAIIKVARRDRGGLYGHGHFLTTKTLSQLNSEIMECDYSGSVKRGHEFAKKNKYLKSIGKANITNNTSNFGLSNLDELFGGKHFKSNKKFQKLEKLYDLPLDADFRLQYTQQPVWDSFIKSFPPGIYPPVVTMDDITGIMPYKSGIGGYNSFNIALHKDQHKGQRKLALTEIQAMNMLYAHVETNANDVASNISIPSVIFYAGGAPSIKLHLLMDMYPNTKFVLIDPNEFNVYDGRYGLPHYVRQDPDYVEHGDKWGVFMDKGIRIRNKDDYIYLSSSDSNMYESPFYKKKNILWFNPDTGALEQASKPYSDSGEGNSVKRINEHVGEFNIRKRATQASIDYIFNSNHRVYFIEEYFTNDIARMIASARERFSVKMSFWSDIRTNLFMKNSPTDTDIILNTIWMYNWLMIMKPDTAMLKFRTPYMDSGKIEWDNTNIGFPQALEDAKSLGYDFRTQIESTNSLPFFSGEIRLQAWSGSHSTETRLMVKGSDISNDLVVYDQSEYEGKLFFHNMIGRFGVVRNNPLYERDPIKCKKLGMDCCNDCAIEAHTWLDYERICGKPFDPFAAIARLERILKTPLLNRDMISHGMLRPDMTEKELVAIVNKQKYAY